MGKIGYGYGSEWHLLRYLGRHRHKLDRAILKAVGHGDGIEWLDFGFTGKPKQADAELKGLDFFTGPEYRTLKREWVKFWPQAGNPPNWDAVGWLIKRRNPELLLVEAKAHLKEIGSSCGAKVRGGRYQIEKALAEAKAYLGAPADADWLKGYYQLANRLATLYFLRKNDIRARLILLYFLGDKFPRGLKGPITARDWKKALGEQDRHLGLARRHPLKGRIHKLFLPVTG